MSSKRLDLPHESNALIPEKSIARVVRSADHRRYVLAVIVYNTTMKKRATVTYGFRLHIQIKDGVLSLGEC